MTETMSKNAGESPSWAADELKSLDLGDARLNRRAVMLVEAIARRPEASLPEAMGDWARSKAGYRFCANERVKAEAVCEAHYRRSVERAEAEERVLVMQDTTELNYSSHPSTTGLGTLDNPKSSGVKLHSSLAVSEAGVPLGLIGQRLWHRPSAEQGKATTRKTRTTQDKESQRWLDTLAAVQDRVTSPFVLIGDRESDIFDLFIAPRRDGVELLVRAGQDRRIDHPQGKLKAALAAQAALGEMSVTVPATPGTLPCAGKRHERQAKLSLKVLICKVYPPQQRRDLSETVSLNAVLAEEQDPPQGETAIRWLLLTTLPVTSLAQAQQCVTFYSLRWLIERYHYVLKQGCRVENLQLETAARLERALALYTIVAWRLLYLTYQARLNPDSPCDQVLTQPQWQVLACTALNSPNPPEQPPTLQQAVRWVARLGGFLARKHDGEPSVKVLWRGLRRLDDNVPCETGIASTYCLLRSPYPSAAPSQDVGNA